MKTKARVFFVLVLLTVVFLAVGCGGGNTQSAVGTASGGGEYPIFRGNPNEEYYMLPFLANADYWLPCYATFKQAGNILGVKTFYTGTVNYDNQELLTLFDQTLAKNPKGIVVPPLNADVMVEPIARARSQGVAVVTWGSDSPEANRNGWVAADDSRQGESGAIALADGIGGRGKVMLCRVVGQSNTQVRADAFVALIKARYPGIQIVAEEPTEQDPDKAYRAVMTVAQMHPDLAGIYALTAVDAIGASRAAVELGGNTAKIKVVTNDTNDQILDMLKKGDVYATVTQDQGMQGWMAMMILFSAAHPEWINPVKGNTENPVSVPWCQQDLVVITKDNADLFYMDNYAKSLGYRNVDEMLAPGGPGIDPTFTKK
jgi:ribose transport system substrate-binding protein